MKTIIHIAGARPNFMKIAPLLRAFENSARLRPLLVHTGQHYDRRMSALFFEQLGIPPPSVNLEVGSASHALMTAEIMKRFEPVLLEHQPEAVLVVGDVNSTIACGLVAVKLGVKLIHVEAGLRSFDRTMPEEINRLLTDAISDVLFCTEQSGVDNLLREGVPQSKIHLVGNVMIDTLLANRERAEGSAILDELRLAPGQYAVLTLHRPSNVDDPAAFSRILSALEDLQRRLPVVFPIHPRTRDRLAELGLQARVESLRGLLLIDPLGYFDFLKLMSRARLMLTDSGGIQEETAILKIPCVTLRENTERPVTVAGGGNQVVGTRTEQIIAACERALDGAPEALQTPPLWDGRAAERIVAILERELD